MTSLILTESIDGGKAEPGAGVGEGRDRGWQALGARGGGGGERGERRAPPGPAERPAPADRLGAGREPRGLPPLQAAAASALWPGPRVLEATRALRSSRAQRRPRSSLSRPCLLREPGPALGPRRPLRPGPAVLRREKDHIGCAANLCVTLRCKAPGYLDKIKVKFVPPHRRPLGAYGLTARSDGHSDPQATPILSPWRGRAGWAESRTGLRVLRAASRAQAIHLNLLIRERMEPPI
ncbi:uncharacterized protein LOC128594807 [Nycticebus coucang]|uniref:uncharacterized protein LOC128594807 n=1 Tax=Nycticebus coucang TaxID=9470 RepID=UPI00234E0B9B|nr:uncharacterized protein LOC128594807 [Nycticebus coucang]